MIELLEQAPQALAHRIVIPKLRLERVKISELRGDAVLKFLGGLAGGHQALYRVECSFFNDFTLQIPAFDVSKDVSILVDDVRVHQLEGVRLQTISWVINHI